VTTQRGGAEIDGDGRCVWCRWVIIPHHDNTSMQVFAVDGSHSRLVWVHDTLPDELTGWLATAMDQLIPTIQRTLASPSASTPRSTH
jgi:hypothetical protein